MIKEEKKAISGVKQEALAKTSLFSKFKGGWALKLVSMTEDTESRLLYKFQKASESYLFKSCACPLDDAKAIEEAKNEYQLSLACCKLSQDVLKPIEYQEIIDQSTKKHTIEILYECFGESLRSVVKKLDGKQIFSLMLKALDALTVLDAKEVFHADIRPETIFTDEGRIKILFFGNSVRFEKKIKQIEQKKLTDIDLMYYPPEVIRLEKYTNSKVDVYSWGMTLYELMAEADIVNEVKLKMKDYKSFMENIKNITIKGDTDGSLKNKVIEILLQVLSENADTRPTLSQLAEQLLDRNYYREELKKANALINKHMTSKLDILVIIELTYRNWWMRGIKK